MKKLKTLVVAIAFLSGASAASAATTLDAGQYSLSYDETTSFGSLSSWFSSGNTYGFSWTVPSSVEVTSLSGVPASGVFNLPSFTLSATPGWSLSGNFTASIGNLVFTEVLGGTTSASTSMDLSVNGGGAAPLGGFLDPTVTVSTVSVSSGYYSGSYSAATGPFAMLSVSNGTLTLTATDGLFASIIAQPQNKLEFSFTALPVPEPETYAMMMAGLGLIGFMARRRK